MGKKLGALRIKKCIPELEIELDDLKLRPRQLSRIRNRLKEAKKKHDSILVTKIRSASTEPSPKYDFTPMNIQDYELVTKKGSSVISYEGLCSIVATEYNRDFGIKNNIKLRTESVAAVADVLFGLISRAVISNYTIKVPRFGSFRLGGRFNKSLLAKNDGNLTLVRYGVKFIPAKEIADYIGLACGEIIEKK